MLTGLLGNLCLASYFIKKRETEVTVVQTLGVISINVVMLQLAMVKAMHLPQFIVTSVVVASGLIINFTQYFNLLHPSIWSFWEDFMTISGVSTLQQMIYNVTCFLTISFKLLDNRLPWFVQVMWSTFIPYVPNTILPGISAFAIAVTAVLMGRMGKLPEKGVKFLGLVSGWTATLLFMWMGVAQMVILWDSKARFPKGFRTEVPP
ncbi:hypothetical protein ACS0TY_003201 [Phlomoides rotata]